MTCPERKSVEPIALLVGDGRVSALQKFLNSAPWDHDAVQLEIQAVFADELAPTAQDPAVGVVGLIRRTAASDVVPLDGITADELSGRSGEFLNAMEELEQRYVVEVPVTTTVWTEDPAGCIPPYRGRGRVPTQPSRDSVLPVKD